MYVHNFGKARSHGLQPLLESRRAHQAVAGLDGRGFALNVSQNVGNFADVVFHLAFEARDAVVGFLQAEPLVQLDVLLNVQSACEVLHADVMHVEIVARGDRADLIEEAFLAAGARHGIDHDIGVRQYRANPRCNLVRDLLGFLEGHVARHGDGNVGEIAAAGFADAHTTHFQHAVNAVNFLDDAIAHAGWSSVEQGVDGLPRQPPTDINHDARDD